MDAKPMTAALVEQLRDAYLYDCDNHMSDLPDDAADCIDAQAAEITALRAERDAMRAAVFGGTNYAPDLRLGNFLEMIRATEAGRLGGIARAERAEAERDALAARLAVPGDEADDLDLYMSEVRTALVSTDIPEKVHAATDWMAAYDDLVESGRVMAAAIDALRARVAGLEGETARLREGIRLAISTLTKFDARGPLLLGVLDMLRAALSPSAAQEVSDAE